MTDFHSETGPERNNFLRRNRIIAGLSDATLVVESAARGGALITADMASSYNREVLAIPGRINDVRSRGCNGLIKNNLAHMVESPEDIARVLNWDTDIQGKQNLPGECKEDRRYMDLSEEERRILAQVRDMPGIGAGTISNLTRIPIHRVLSTLVEMELKQWITLLPGNIYQPGIFCPKSR
jgi:DNA processing protein